MLRSFRSPCAEQREAISIGYIPLREARTNLQQLCNVTETCKLRLPPANWGLIKVDVSSSPLLWTEFGVRLLPLNELAKFLA